MKFRPAGAAAAGVLLETAVTGEAGLLLSPTISGRVPKRSVSSLLVSQETADLGAARACKGSAGNRAETPVGYQFWWLRANQYCSIFNAWEVGVVVKFELKISCVSGNECETLETESDAIELGSGRMRKSTNLWNNVFVMRGSEVRIQIGRAHV